MYPDILSDILISTEIILESWKIGPDCSLVFDSKKEKEKNELLKREDKRNRKVE